MRAKEFERWAEKVGIPDGDDGCMIWLGAKNRDGGYGVFGVEGKTERAHRLSFEHFVGPIPKGFCVLHKCDNPACCRPDHLSIGSHQQNMTDMMAKGRHVAPRGQNHGSAKLTEAGVRKIKKLFLEGMSQTAIAKIMTVSQRQINNIIRGKNWAHVTLEITTCNISATETHNMATTINGN